MNHPDSQMQLPEHAIWQQFGGDGLPAHFYHANGFPPGLYQPLLNRLRRQLNLSALSMRPIWSAGESPPRRRDWEIYVQDLLAHIEHNVGSPVVGMGHSMGAACTVMAAVRRPDLFRGLILIEPVTVSRLEAQLLNVVPEFLVRRMEPIRSTLVRNDVWSSRDEFMEEMVRHRAYRRFDDEAIQALREHGVTEAANGEFRLAFPKAWEAHNYLRPPCLLKHVSRLQVPSVVIQTRPSVFCSAASWREWRRRCPNAVFVENPDFGHLLPIENASVTEDLIRQALTQVRW